MNVSRQIGWSAESNLLYQILKQLNRLTSIISNIVGGGGDSRPYKVYTALLTQTGTSAPVATVLENTLGSISFTYESTGIYKVLSSSLFTPNKTAVFITSRGVGGPFGVVTGAQFNSIDELFISTMNTSGTVNNILVNSSFEIRVYN
jgi:hypothetical protein